VESFRISGITEKTVVTVLDISGKTMLQRIVSPDETVSVTHLPQGMYIVRTADEVIKLIKR